MDTPADLEILKLAAKELGYEFNETWFLTGRNCPNLNTNPCELLNFGRALLASAWQPIETAPRDGTWVLLAGGECDLVEESRNKGRVVTGRWTTEFYHKPDGNWQFAYYDAGFYGEYKDPTHWQPLPSPPPITPQTPA